MCAGIQVNYTPDGHIPLFKQLVKEGNFAGVHVPAVQVGLTFIETKFVTAEDVEKDSDQWQVIFSYFPNVYVGEGVTDDESTNID